jgi:hypothetical protein
MAALTRHPLISSTCGFRGISSPASTTAHITAANAFGEDRRDDYRAGQRVIIQEMVEVLRAQGFVSGADRALRCLKPRSWCFASGKSRPFELYVLGPRGGIMRRAVQVHPLALAMPPMTEAESLRASIEKDGVKVPLLLYQNKILDGRNRGYFASVLNKPVKIEEFEGTEDEAKRRIPNP